MGQFCELLDMTWNTAPDRAAARAILMLRTLMQEPCELSAAHAISSDLILDDCVPDDYFRRLVEAGRIRFRLRPNGSSAEQALIEGFENPAYRMDSWPGVWPTPESTDWTTARELREAAVAVLKGRTKRTSHPALDARLHNAQALFASLKCANYGKRESRHGGFFADLVRNSRKYVNRQFSGVSAILTDSAAELDRRGIQIDRSTMYTEIERRADVLVEPVAKGVIDNFKNVAVATSLDEKLLSVDRPALNRGGFAAVSNAKRAHADVKIIDSSKVVDFERLAFSWQDVHKAMELSLGRSPSSADMGIVRDRLVDCLVTKRFAARSREINVVVTKGLPAVAVGTGVGSWFLTTLSGELGKTVTAALLSILAITGFVVADKMANRSVETLKKKYRAEAKKEIALWSDGFPSASACE